MVIAICALFCALVLIACVTVLNMGRESYDPPVSEWNGDYIVAQQKRGVQLRGLATVATGVALGMLYVLMELISFIFVAVAVVVLVVVGVVVVAFVGAVGAVRMGSMTVDE